MAADLKGKVALVTGATSGIGFETADYLAGERGEEGREMVGACDRRDGRAAGGAARRRPGERRFRRSNTGTLQHPPLVCSSSSSQQPAATSLTPSSTFPFRPIKSNQIKNSARRRRHPRRAQRRGGPEDRQGDHVSAQIQIQITADCADLQMMADRACRGRWHPPVAAAYPLSAAASPFRR